MNKQNRHLVIHICIFLFFHIFGFSRLAVDLIDLNSGNADFSLLEQGFNAAYIYITQYIVISILLAFLFIYACVVFTNKINSHITPNKPYISHMITAIICNICLIQLNNNVYPASYYENSNSLTSGLNNQLLTFIICIPLIILIIKTFNSYTKVVLGFALLGLFFLSPILSALNNFNLPTEIKQDDIIIIGIDSLRPELIDDYMPFLSSQLKESSVLENSITPFARTYPAWMSILTGKLPVNHGARFNLQEEETLNPTNQYLPKELQTQGYETIYASDERRFSNIGATQGFNHIIGPRTGTSDFILGNFADFPLSNLALFLPFSEKAFPEIYANRASKKLYYPYRFINLVDQEIGLLNLEQPLFLAIHFCLAHWPYTYPQHKNTPAYPEKPQYPDALASVDKQIKNLFSSLEKSGRLSSSKIIFLSDHGESWGSVDTGVNHKDGSPLSVTDFGHGMNILSTTSHNILIAFKNFKKRIYDHFTLSSLIDIRPTVLDEIGLLNTTASATYDGASLFSPIAKNRVIALESGLVIAEANKEKPDAAAITKSNASRFTILPSGLLRLKTERVTELTPNKQIAVINNNSGFFMGPLTSNSQSSLYLDYGSQSYTSIKNISELSQRSPILATKLCELFSETQPNVKNFCVTN